MSAWLYLALAILLEVTGTFLLKLSGGFEKWWWGTLAIVAFSACFWMFALALKAIPVGVAYAIWAGIGIVAASVIGLVAFGEKLGAVQIACIGLVVVGVIGLQLTTKH